LIDGLTAAMLLADKGYDSNAILEQALSQGMQPLFRQKKIAKINASTTRKFTGSGIKSRMRSCISSAVEASPPVMPKTPCHSSLQSRFDASTYGAN
jgi:hypothetical protein